VRRPKFPTVDRVRARVYLGSRPRRRGKAVSEYGIKTLACVMFDGEAHTWRASKLEALWRALPWRDGVISWSYDPDRRVLVCAWVSPLRRGRIALFEAR
jgi:hypothetical protein